MFKDGDELILLSQVYLTTRVVRRAGIRRWRLCGFGRTLVRIGRRWAALRTALLSMAQGAFSPKACCGRLEIARKRRSPPGGAGVVERPGSSVQGRMAAGRAPPILGRWGAQELGWPHFGHAGLSPSQCCPKRQKLRWRQHCWDMRGCGTPGSRYGSHKEQDPRSKRLGNRVSVLVRAW